jgi:hypothetical protein
MDDVIVTREMMWLIMHNSWKLVKCSVDGDFGSEDGIAAGIKNNG